MESARYMCTCVFMHLYSTHNEIYVHMCISIFLCLYSTHSDSIQPSTQPALRDQVSASRISQWQQSRCDTVASATIGHALSLLCACSLSPFKKQTPSLLFCLPPSLPAQSLLLHYTP